MIESMKCQQTAYYFVAIAIDWTAGAQCPIAIDSASCMRGFTSLEDRPNFLMHQRPHSMKTPVTGTT